jgi:hypothetical protein
MSEGRIPAPELLAGVSARRYADEVMRERYPHPGHELTGQISDRLRLAAELGQVDLYPQRGVEPAADAVPDSQRYASLRAAHSTHLGHPLQGRSPSA